MRNIRNNLWPVAAAIVVGFALLPIAQREYADWSRERDERIERVRPVVTMRGDLLRRDGTAVVINLSGTKHRECRYIGIEAYSLNAGVRHLANIARADEILAIGKTRPTGVYDFGIWRIWPIDSDAEAVMVFVEHLCNGVLIRTLAAEVLL